MCIRLFDLTFQLNSTQQFMQCSSILHARSRCCGGAARSPEAARRTNSELNHRIVLDRQIELKDIYKVYKKYKNTKFTKYTKYINNIKYTKYM